MKLILSSLKYFFSVFLTFAESKPRGTTSTLSTTTVLKTFLLYLNYVIDDEKVDDVEIVRIPINEKVAEKLREIK